MARYQEDLEWVKSLLLGGILKSSSANANHPCRRSGCFWCVPRNDYSLAMKCAHRIYSLRDCSCGVSYPPCPCSKETCYLVHLGHWFTIPLGFTWPYLFILFRDWSRESSGLYHRRTWTVPKSGFRAFWTASACLAGQPKNHSWYPVVPKRSKFKDKRWLRDDKSDKRIKRQRLDAERDENSVKMVQKALIISV